MFWLTVFCVALLVLVALKVNEPLFGGGGGGVVTVICADAVRVSPVLGSVPVTVNVEVPAGVDVLGATDSVAELPAATVPGFKTAVDACGSPETERLMVPAPLVTIVYETEFPTCTDWLAGVMDSEKSCATSKETSSKNVYVVPPQPASWFTSDSVTLW